MTENKNVEIIKDGEIILAIVVYDKFDSDGINFFTPDDFPQQLACSSYKAGSVVRAHVHNEVERKIVLTQEILLVKKGKLRVNLYDGNNNFFDSRTLEAGDVILFANGGHGIEMLEDSRIIEIKQGPYLGEKDKMRFDGVEKS